MTAVASSRTHMAGVVALLSTGITAFDSEGPPAGTTAARYVVVYGDPGTPEGTLGDRHRDLYTEFQVTAVGTTPEQCRWAVDKARSLLLSAEPVVAGRVVQPLWQIGQPPPMRRDDDTQPPTYVLPVSYGMRSGPVA